ncbi:MAG: hypothetical protein JW969_20510 [Spirochaetales bacterium]|nr:hypothetical protein [Spirochaetales bacterium]
MKAQLDLHTEWVNKIFGTLTLDEKIGQLMVPDLHPAEIDREINEVLKEVTPGGVFLFSGTREEFLKTTEMVQKKYRIPVLISSDLESGAGGMIRGKTIFPTLMSLAATDNDKFAYEMGKAAALEGRESGVQWSFAPVVDINAHPFNPIANTRSLGDDPERIIRLARELVRGMQENGLIATAKHFPGDGFDDRDQHLCTTINNLSEERWMKLSGRVFKEVIDAGVLSIMVGHIAMPAFDGDGETFVDDLPPAVISRNIVTGVLRKKLGFEGLIITDAIGMAGAIAKRSMDEIVPLSIAAGNDMVLFAKPARHFKAIKNALNSGVLTMEIIDTAVRRILALKEKCGLNKKTPVIEISSEVREDFRKTSVAITETALTVVCDKNSALPLNLKKGSRVFSFQLRSESWLNASELENCLRERGCEIVHMDDATPDNYKLTYHEIAEFDAVIISFLYGANYGTNSIRPSGPILRRFWQLCTPAHKNQVVISFGSPYIMYDFPHLATYINAYSSDILTQQACARLLLGEIKAQGKSPVNLQRPYLIKEQLIKVIG